MASSNVSVVPKRKRREEVVLANFAPNDNQRRFLQLALAGGGPLNIGQLCHQVGISRTTYYRWREQPGFNAWMSAHWVSSLLADGGRLLSIARSFAVSDYRYWRAMAELIFDPRGLGLLTAWQQRMSEAGAAVAPLFLDGDPDLDPDLEELDVEWQQNPPQPEDATPASDTVVEKECSMYEDRGEEDAKIEAEDAAPGPQQPPRSEAVVTPSSPAESTTCIQKTEHFAKTRPSEFDPPHEPPPSWSPGPIRFR